MEPRQEMAAIGARLKLARRAAGLSRAEAAVIADVRGASTIGNWEAGRHLPCLIQFKTLLTLYGVSATKILYGQNMFEMTGEEIAELRAAAQHFSPALRRRLDLLLGLLRRFGGNAPPE